VLRAGRLADSRAIHSRAGLLRCDSVL
jgi:hypothetical protein